MIVTFLYHYNQFYEITVKSSLLLLLGSICFFYGSRLMTKRLPRRLSFKKNRPIVLRINMFVLLSILTIIALANNAIVNVKYLMSGMNFNDIQLMNLSGPVGSRDFFITIITMLIAMPFVYVVIPILGLELCRPKKRWWVILLTLLIIFLFVLQGGRRAILIYIIPSVLYIVIDDLRNYLSKKIKSKLLLIIISLSAIIIYLISWLSFQRDTSFKETGYLYLSGGIASFSERIEHIDKFYLGAGTLHGFLAPIMIGVKYLTHSYPSWWVNLDSLVEAKNEIKIGPAMYMMAFNTMFYIPYIDFGVVGVLLISLLVGIIYGWAYRRVFSDSNSLNKSVYALLIIGLFGSMYTLYFSQSPYVLSFIYIYFIFKKKALPTF